ncbi:MAG: type I-E CRISPR-associated protein Cas5/CasD [Gammaproteobacteria bacterium]
MVDLLMFQLYGPLAAWGEPAVGEYRPTATHPGKSQIVGLLGAALGLCRDQEVELAALADSFGLAVRTEAEGELARDYHTSQVPPNRRGQRLRTRREELRAGNLYTILSQRDYRVDAAWTCALWVTDAAQHPLAHLAEALRRPRFVLYLGRKSCPPALPLNPRIVQAATLKQAFADYSLDEHLAKRLLSAKGPRRHVWEAPLPAGLESGFEDTEYLWQVPRKDRPRSRVKWQFGARDEHHAIA